MEWIPTLNDRTGPLYRRIVDALAADIAAGRLLRGQQLPTHRWLAESLRVDLSTITHAYREARARGLVEARVGQGTFVAETMAQRRASQPPWVTFDLSMNLPPQPLDADLEGRILRGITSISREDGLSAYLNYREAAGTFAEREAAAGWLKPRVPNADPSRLLICPGTQTALSLLLAALTSPGDTVLTEALTYPGLKAAATFASVTLAGVATDAAGILPDALRIACRRHKPKALYLNPTIHNPTTVTMPPARRREVAEILRKTGLTLIEDDAYGALAPEAVPIAALVPEQTYYAASISKCIAPGLRISFLLAPDKRRADEISERLRANVQMTAPLMAMLVARWIRDRNADAIVRAIRDEAAARQVIAARILADWPYAAHPHGHHIWLSLPRNWARDEFVTHVQRRGLAIVGAEAFRVSGDAPSAIRVALGAAASRHELSSALSLLAEALHGRGETGVV